MNRKKIHQSTVLLVTLIALSGLLISTCIQVPNQYVGLSPGIWRGQFILQDKNQLIVTKGKDEEITRETSIEKNKFGIPFNFEIRYNKEKKPEMILINGEERIVFDQVVTGRNIKNGDDTFLIDLAPYDAYIKGVFDINQMNGNFIVRDKINYSIPFEANHSQDFRFEKLPRPTMQKISGLWQMVFSKDTKDAYAAVGEFVENNQKVTGTFRTETGDFRFLEGSISGDFIRLSCFDGAHAFLFDGNIHGDSLTGMFYSGNHYKTTFHGIRNDRATLGSANSLTKKVSNEAFLFRFQNQDKNWISNTDEIYTNKIKIIQITGTWCPNCRDESEFLINYFKENPNKNVSVIALAFERYADKEKAFGRISNYKIKMNLPYEILLAGRANKDSASALIPMIDRIKAFPTMLFLDKNNYIRKIHTGFDGPATSKYIEFKKEFSETINSLTKE
ncbi:MAG: TlpA family protein disulfide reductase [Bacteroidota bacterium]|nr:TlpA family protein disulfide reductase [Bacteroidota bacterium]